MAADGFRQYLALSPPKPKRAVAGLFLGRSLLELGRDEEALPVLDEAARADDQGHVAPLARYLRTRLFLKLSRFAEAEKETHRWLRYFPRHRLRWEVRLLRAEALEGLGRLDDAASMYEKLSRQRTSPRELSLEALFRLGSVRAARGRPDEARRAWEALIKRDPSYRRAAQARLQLAAQHLSQGRFQEALSQAEALLKGFPDSAEAKAARIIRAEGLFSLKRWQEAWRAYQEAAKVEESLLEASHWERAGLAAYKAGMFGEAAQALARAGDGPQGANLYLLARALRQAGKDSEALKTYGRLMGKYPEGRWARLSLEALSEVAQATGLWKEAGQAYRSYIKGAPSEARLEALYLLAHGELASGQAREAARIFQEVARRAGGLDRFPDVRYKRAVALTEAGGQRAALELLEALSQREREAVGQEALLALEAEVHRGLGHLEAAQERYRELLARWPGAEGASRWLLALAELEEARGRVEEALSAYGRWLELYGREPAAPLVRLSLARLLATVGRGKEARENIKVLLEAASPEVSAQAFLLEARLALEDKDYGSALEAAEEALKVLPEKGPSRVLALWRKAEALRGLGRSREALKQYRWLSQHAGDERVRKASAEAARKLASLIEKGTKAQ